MKASKLKRMGPHKMATKGVVKKFKRGRRGMGRA